MLYSQPARTSFDLLLLLALAVDALVAGHLPATRDAAVRVERLALLAFAALHRLADLRRALRVALGALLDDALAAGRAVVEARVELLALPVGHLVFALCATREPHFFHFTEFNRMLKR